MLEPGDPVVDRDSEDADVMRVFRTDIGKADDVDVNKLGKTVHEVNPSYPQDDTVIETVYETWLNSHVPNWVDWHLEEFQSSLSTYAKRWSVPVKSYYYPRERLKLIKDPKKF